MVEDRFTHYCPIEYEYEYRFTEYEYDLPDERCSSSVFNPCQMRGSFFINHQGRCSVCFACSFSESAISYNQDLIREGIGLNDHRLKAVPFAASRLKVRLVAENFRMHCMDK